MNRSLRLALLPFVLSAAACGDQVGAWGDSNSIVAAVDPAVWETIQDPVYQALEPTVFTVTDEKAFTVTHAVPGDDIWNNTKKFRQMLLVGTASDFWVAQALEKVDDLGEITPPIVLQAEDVWARDQLVTILVVGDDPASGVSARLPELAALFDDQYRTWARRKMYVSGQDTALADTLMTQHGFSLLLPQVYYWDEQDGVFVFRNDNPDPSELIRQIAVTSRSPIPPAAEFQADSILGWRAAIAAAHYTEPQVVNLDRRRAGPARLGDMQLYEIQAAWSNAPDSGWPAGGPFITRAIVCPEQDRMYLVDAWLYAPGKEKYEYMIQLQTILNTFRCGSTA